MIRAGAGQLARPLSCVRLGALVSGLGPPPTFLCPQSLASGLGSRGTTEGLASNPASLQMSSSDCVPWGSRCCPPTQAPSPASLASDPVGVGFPAWALVTPTLVRTWDPRLLPWGKGVQASETESQGFGVWVLAWAVGMKVLTVVWGWGWIGDPGLQVRVWVLGEGLGLAWGAGGLSQGGGGAGLG